MIAGLLPLASGAGFGNRHLFADRSAQKSRLTPQRT
jgi:hypothetical protein